MTRQDLSLGLAHDLRNERVRRAVVSFYGNLAALDDMRKVDAWQSLAEKRSDHIDRAACAVTSSRWRSHQTQFQHKNRDGTVFADVIIDHLKFKCIYHCCASSALPAECVS
jgi:hypothetical protein